jgi:hypothetical protein
VITPKVVEFAPEGTAAPLSEAHHIEGIGAFGSEAQHEALVQLEVTRDGQVNVAITLPLGIFDLTSALLCMLASSG